MSNSLRHSCLVERRASPSLPEENFTALDDWAHTLAAHIDTLIVTAATNACCESTARYAMMLSYKVIFVHGKATNNEDEHNATLGNMLAMFADVISTREVVERLAKATIRPPSKGRSRYTVLAPLS